MKDCPNCHAQIREESAFCPVCGTSIDTLHAFPEPYPPQHPMSPPPPVYTPPAVKPDPYDHTKIYYPGDIASNKVVCMLVYLLDFIGVLIALRAAPNSEYTKFHVIQALKIVVVEALLGIATALLCWTVVIPVLALIALVILTVIKLISFYWVCGGKAIEPYLIRSIKFLK